MKVAKFLLCVAVASCAWAQEEEAEEDALKLAVVRAVEAVRVNAEKTPGNWLYPLPETRKLIGSKEKIIPAKEVTVTVPVYEYETYETLVPSESTDGTLKKVMMRRIKKQIGTREEKRLVGDSSGTLKMKVYAQEWEKDSVVRWAQGMMGANGFLVAALRSVGVPEEDPLLAPTLEGLAQVVDRFGPPDMTWDLAGMVAGFSMMSGPMWERRTQVCASKLMEGQVQTGGCMGMWGPVSVSPELLAVVFKEMAAMAEARDELKAEVTAEARAVDTGKSKNNRKLVKMEDELADLEGQIKSLQENGWWISMGGMMLFNSLGSPGMPYFKLTKNDDRIEVPAYPYLIHNQTTTDLASTALALFALRLAAQTGRLPEQSVRPAMIGQKGRALTMPAPRRATEVVRLAAQALDAGKRRGWNEMNRQQAVEAFSGIKLVPQVSKASPLPQLEAPVNVMALLNGLEGTFSAWELAQRRFLRFPFDAPEFKATVEKLDLPVKLRSLDDDTLLLEQMMALGLTAQVKGPREAMASETWQTLADEIVKRQARGGGWGRPDGRIIHASSSIMARRNVLDDMTGVQLQQSYDKMHLSLTYAKKMPWGTGARLWSWPVTTAGALLFLSEGLPDDFVCATEGFGAPE